MLLKRLSSTVLIFGLLNLFFSPQIQGADVTITATVPNSTATFSGWAPASSVVTIKDNGSAVATTVTNPGGQFNRTVDSSAGAHDFALFYTDTAGLTTPETTFSVNLPNQIDTPISDIHLPPTIALSKNPIVKGETVAAFGQAAPGSTLHFFLNGSEKATIVLSTSNWQVNIGPSDYVVGTNTLYAYLSRSLLADSVNSYSLTLTVNNCRRSDLNCDGRVNLTDFSILLYYWNSHHAPADISGDGTVNLIDFSIMMFDWTG